MSKYGDFFGPYFPVFCPNTEKYGPEKALYLDTFHAVIMDCNCNFRATVILHQTISLTSA